MKKLFILVLTVVAVYLAFPRESEIPQFTQEEMEWICIQEEL